MYTLTNTYMQAGVGRSTCWRSASICMEIEPSAGRLRRRLSAQRLPDSCDHEPREAYELDVMCKNGVTEAVAELSSRVSTS